MFPDIEVPNCINLTARRYLAECARDLRVLEIGTYIGVSTAAIASTAKHVVTVDMVDVNADDAYWATDPVLEGLSRVRPSELLHHRQVEFVTGTAPDCLTQFGAASFDMAFLDAWKHAHDVYRTLEHLCRIVRPGGRVIVDDVYPRGIPAIPGGCDDPGPWLALLGLTLVRNGAPGFRMIEGTAMAEIVV